MDASIDQQNRRRLLIIDDDTLVARALRRALRPDFEVTVASSGVEAIENVRQLSFDCVLCDIHMPQMDGQEFLVSVAKVHPELPRRVVFMSGGVSDSLRGTVEANGNQIVPKPFDLEEVRTLLTRLCNP